MVKNSGVKSFLLQRFSAVYMGLFLLGLIIYFAINPIKDFYSWQMLFQNNFIKIIVILFFLSLIVHAWIGLWSVVTDYLKGSIRMTALVLILITLFASFVWSILILWS